MNNDQVLSEAERYLSLSDADAAERTLKTKWSDPARAPADAQHILANARAMRGRYDEAVELLRAAIKSEPKALRHHIALGHVFSQANKSAEAADAYAAALKIDPNWPGLLLVFARASHVAGRQQDSEKAARQLLQQAPSADAWDVLSWALRAQDKGEEALAAANAALKLDPNHTEAWHSRGVALVLTGKTDEGLAIFDDLVSRGIAAPALWLHRAGALDTLGRHAEAEDVYADAARRWPNAPNLQARLAQRRRG